MNTTIYEYTYTNYVSQPFQSRNITVIFDGHLDNNFSDALHQLKQNISLNRPSVLLMWYDTNNQFGHYRVATGYNQTGLFFHDSVSPDGYRFYSGPNIFLDNTLVEKLWAYYDNWALILQSGPTYDITPEPGPDLNLIISGILLFLIAMIVGIVGIAYFLTRTRQP